MQRTNARGRHTYLPEFKRWIVEQAVLPGMSLAGLSMSNQVNANQLRRWVQLHAQRREALVAPAAPCLLPVTIVASPPPPSPAAAGVAVPVEVELAGAVVRVRDGVAPATLRLVLNCLRGATP